MRSRGRQRALIVAIIVVAVGWLANELRVSPVTEARSAETVTAAEAFERRLSDVWIEDAGSVDTLLRDDDEGSRHQRFIIRLRSGRTILVAHNVDIAPRVPLERGDEVSLRGEYVWNDKGGLVHWTHRDPGDRRVGGWIRHDGRTYR